MNTAQLISQILRSISGLGDSSYSYVALIVFIVSGSYLYWRQSYLNKIETLPARDRLIAIRDLNPRVPSEIEAKEWLSSRRQAFMFWAYVSTVLATIVVFSMVYSRTHIFPKQRREALDAYHVLDSKFSAYEEAARDVNDSLSQRGRALASGGATAEDAENEIGQRVGKYNRIFNDVRNNRETYEDNLLKDLPERPDLRRSVDMVFAFLLNNIHQSGFLKINALRERLEQSKVAATAKGGAPDPAVIEELANFTGAIEKDLKIFDDQLVEFRQSFSFLQ